MPYPKRTEFEKREFIAKVYNLLESNHETKKVNHLNSLLDVDKQYQVAQRYCREIGETFDNVSKTPNSDFESLIAPTEETDENTEEEGFTEDAEEEETTEDTEESDFKLNSMTAEEVREHIQDDTSKNHYKRKWKKEINQKKSERKKELFGRYNEILDWLQCIDDGIIKGDVFEARKMIDTLDGYAERLHNLLDKVYVERTEKVLKQLAELESVLGKEEIMRINDSIGAYVPIKE
jgi:hypothetical protein